MKVRGVYRTPLSDDEADELLGKLPTEAAVVAIANDSLTRRVEIDPREELPSHALLRALARRIQRGA